MKFYIDVIFEPRNKLFLRKEITEEQIYDSGVRRELCQELKKQLINGLKIIGDEDFFAYFCKFSAFFEPDNKNDLFNPPEKVYF